MPDALSATYEMMKTTSLDRHATVKQQLRCSPLELTDGPMACFVALQNVLELVGRVDCFICHPAELYLEGKGERTPSYTDRVLAHSAPGYSARRVGQGAVLELACISDHVPVWALLKF